MFTHRACAIVLRISLGDVPCICQANTETHKEKTMKDKQVLTHKVKKAAKRLFKKLPHNTRIITNADYAALPKE